MANKTTNSLLIGNGLDIQVGGNDYQNKWIIVRLLAKAKAGKYDKLFVDSNDASSTLKGDEIVALFNGMVVFANEARENKCDHLAEKYAKKYNDEDVLDALKDFQKNHIHKIISVEEIGMEDWILIFQLFLIKYKNLEQYKAIKAGFERMVFDAIYCEGNIQNLHSKMSKSSKSYFNSFDNIFTINYDNTIEKLTKHTVLHLHGEYSTKSISENPNNVFGYMRKKNGQSIWFPPKFRHCNCNAILDFSGNRKYKLATSSTKAFLEFEKFKELIGNNKDSLEQMLEKFPDELQESMKIGIEKNLQCGHNYHFQDFEQLTGMLTIIGLAPQNDSHIFSCINKSDIEKVVFYHHFGKRSKDEVNEQIKARIKKSCEIENIKELWDEIRINQPAKRTYNVSEKQMNLLNAVCAKRIETKDISRQLESIPTFTKKVIIEMMDHEISKKKYQTPSRSEKEFSQNFVDFGETLKTASISPQALYFLYLNKGSELKTRKNKAVKRK